MKMQLDTIVDASWTFNDLTHAVQQLSHTSDHGEPYYQPLCKRLYSHLTIVQSPSRTITCIRCISELARP